MTPFASPVRNQRQRGLSMVELLVGVALGLFIAASAATLLANHLRESRTLLLESRLMQDLRTAADLVTRDLRRAGYWGAAASGVWARGASGVASNPYSALGAASAASDAITFQFSRDASENNAVDSNEQFGYRLRNGTVEMQLGAANWQALTDVGTVTVTAFSVTPTVQTVSLASYCARPCVSASSCPQQLVRSIAVQLTGRPINDPTVSRSVRSEVRLRNDAAVGTCPV